LGLVLTNPKPPKHLSLSRLFETFSKFLKNFENFSTKIWPDFGQNPRFWPKSGQIAKIWPQILTKKSLFDQKSDFLTKSGLRFCQSGHFLVRFLKSGSDFQNLTRFLARFWPKSQILAKNEPFGGRLGVEKVLTF